MAEIDTAKSDDIHDILLLTNSKYSSGGHYGYRKDYLQDHLNEMERNFLTCPHCNGIMREACVRKGKITCKFCNKSPHYADAVDLVRNSVSKLNIKCPLERGCEWKGKLAEAVTHLKMCPNFRELCPLECGGVIERCAMVNHTEQVCPLHEVKCDFCDEIVKFIEVTGHIVNCLFRPMNCECGKELCRNDHTMHIETECPLAEVECPYVKYSCDKGKIPRKDLLNHKKEFYIQHQDMLEAENSKLKLQINGLNTKLKFKKDMEYIEFNFPEISDSEREIEGQFFYSGNSKFLVSANTRESLTIELAYKGRSLFTDNHKTHCQIVISMPDDEFEFYHDEYTVVNSEVGRQPIGLFTVSKDVYSKYVQQDNSLTFRMYYDSKV